MIEAGTSVSKERTTTATIRNQMMLDRYVNLVRMFSPDDFVSLTTQEDMAIRLFHGKKGGYNGENCGGSLRNTGRRYELSILQNYRRRYQVFQVVIP